MWKERIRQLTPDCTFSPPASPRGVVAAETALGVPLPDDLRRLFDETNGVAGEYGLGLVWPVERVEADNLAFRTSADFRERYMPFDHLLFFADAGNGDQFAFAVLAGAVRRPDVFTWSHEDDSRRWAAPSLDRYLEWWLSGRIRL